MESYPLNSILPGTHKNFFHFQPSKLLPCSPRNFFPDSDFLWKFPCFLGNIRLCLILPAKTGIIRSMNSRLQSFLTTVVEETKGVSDVSHCIMTCEYKELCKHMHTYKGAPIELCSLAKKLLKE